MFRKLLALGVALLFAVPVIADDSVYKTYNCTALTGGASRALDAIPVAALEDKDRAIVMDSNDNLWFFEFQATATDAENTANHPYTVRPDDYAAAGVWYEIALKTLDIDASLISSTTNKPTFTLENTNADGTGPRIYLMKDSASPADLDELGQISFIGDDSAGNATTFASLVGYSQDVTHTTEDGLLIYSAISDGDFEEFYRIDGSVGSYVINDASLDHDFRVESDTQTHSLFVQGSDGAVGINDSTPSYQLDVAGTGHFTGKVTMDSGSDPPYVLYDYQTRDGIIAMVKKDIPPEKLNGATMFFNGETGGMEIFIAFKGEFRDFTGKLLASVPPIVKTYETTDKFYLNPETGEVKKTSIPKTKTGYRIKSGYKIDSTTGKFFALDPETGKSITEVDKEQAIESR